MNLLKKINFLILTSIFIFGNFAQAKQIVCGNFLADQVEEKAELNHTQAVIAYLNFLTSQKIIDEKELASLSQHIKDKNALLNPIPEKAGDSAYQIHRENFHQYLALEDLDLQQIYQWILSHIEKNQQVQKKKEETQETTQFAAIPMKFHRVEKGEFYWGSAGKLRSFLRQNLNYDKNKKVILTHDIEVMNTPVTQAMWVKEMGENPAADSEGPNGIVVNVNGKFIKMQPDNPVESITWYSAAMFANYMSRKHKLKEVYDFSEVQFIFGTSAKVGNLRIESGEVKINGPSIYETEGYRLPTEAEQSFLQKDRGRSNTGYFTGVTKNNLNEYAWTLWETYMQGGSTHNTKPTGEKKAMMIDGKDFYDLYGNILEWGNDWVDDTNDEDGDTTIKQTKESGLKLSGADPEGLKKGLIRVMRGGHHPVDIRLWADPASRMNWYGFRLVRTVK